MKNTNILIVGVGGQGTLLTSRVLGGLASKMGYDVKGFRGSWNGTKRRKCSNSCSIRR